MLKILNLEPKLFCWIFVFLGQAQFPELNHLLTGPEFRSANRARCSSLQYRSRIGTTSRSDFLKMSLHSGQDAVALAGIPTNLNNLVFLTFLLTKILDIQLWQ